MSVVVVAIVLLAVSLLLAAAVLGWRYRSAAVRDWQAALKQLEPVNVRAFRLLIDPGEERFMRRHLSPGDFQRLWSKREKLTALYLSAIAHNAALLLGVAAECAKSQDPDVREAAVALSRTAGTLRIQVLVLSVRLKMRIVFGDQTSRLGDAHAAYERLTEMFTALVKLQEPSGVSRARAALQAG